MTYKLFLDDERDPPANSGEWVICRNSTEFKQALTNRGFPRYISFDHDLGQPDEDGYTLCKWMCMNDMGQNDNSPWGFPVDFDFYVHSQNPVGAKNIQMYLRQYLNYRNA